MSKSTQNLEGVARWRQARGQLEHSLIRSLAIGNAGGLVAVLSFIGALGGSGGLAAVPASFFWVLTGFAFGLFGAWTAIVFHYALTQSEIYWHPTIVQLEQAADLDRVAIHRRDRVLRRMQAWAASVASVCMITSALVGLILLHDLIG